LPESPRCERGTNADRFAGACQMPFNPLPFVGALFVPFGRLPISFFLVMNALVAAGQGLLYRQCAALKDPWGLQLVVLMVLVWMSFCLSSRRLQDAGYGSLPAFLVMLLAIFTYLGTLDLSLLGATDLDRQLVWETRIDAAWYVYRGAWALLFGVCLLLIGSGRVNAYGSEFRHSETAANRRAPLASEKVHRGTGR
jgi:uncharacterized membrane protein YhaH (DUF805 family)